jgi:hypothetical protein
MKAGQHLGLAATGTGRDIRSAIRSTVKRADTAARHAARSISPIRLIASTASSTLLTRKPVTPSSISSGIDPRLQAITGVPQASASTTDSPNGSSKLTFLTS